MTTAREKWYFLGLTALSLLFFASFEFRRIHAPAAHLSAPGAEPVPAGGAGLAFGQVGRPEGSASTTQGRILPEELAKARKAYEDLRSAMNRLATAASYRRVFRSKNPDGTFTESTAYYKRSSTGVDLYRLDIDVVSPGSSKAPKKVSEEITNEQGTFLIEQRTAGPQTAFLLTDEPNPEARFRQATITAAATTLEGISEAEMLNYSESQNIAPDGSGETLINVTNLARGSPVADLQFRINNATGNVASQEYYGPDGQSVAALDFPQVDINLPLDDSLFCPPASAPVVPAANRVQATQLASSRGTLPQTQP